MTDTRPHMVVFFTWDVSLALWKEKGLLDREVRFYERLVERGVDVTFLTWGDARDAVLEGDLKGIRAIPLYTRMPCPQNKALRLLCSPLILWVARREISNATLLKTNQMWGAWCAVAAKFVFRKPLLLRTGFELYDFTCRQGHGLLRRMFIRLLSTLAYRSANRICLATEADRRFIVETFGITPDKIEIRPNWIDTTLFSPRNVPKQDGHILYVGRLTAQKNLERLVEAVAGTTLTLDLIGDGELREPLQDRARQTGAAVRFLGPVPNDTLPDIYNRYPIFVLPSLYEGNPKTLLEAMSCGRAAVGADVPGIREILQHGENGLLCPPTAEDLRKALTHLMTNPDLRTRLGTKAREKIERVHTLDRLIEKEIASCRSLMETHAWPPLPSCP